jgi:two-component system response regulator MprA
MATSPVPRPRLLIVEDDESILEFLSTVLNDEGYETCLASSQEAALALLHEQRFDLVVADLFVEPSRPRLSSARALQRFCTPTPVGIITGWSLPSGGSELDGFAFLLKKPFDIDDFLAAVAASLKLPLAS